MNSRKYVWKETGIVVLGQVICTAAMFGVFALLKRFSPLVLWGGLLGAFMAILNFFFMAVSCDLAADKAQDGNVKGGQVLVRLSMPVRYIILFLVLFAAAKGAGWNPVALVLPSVFTRPILMIGEFFRKSGKEKK